MLEKQRKYLNDLVSAHFGQVGETLTTSITKEDVLIAGKITLYTGVLFGLTSLASLVYSAKKAYADQTTNYRPPKNCLEISVAETVEHMFPRTFSSVSVSSCDDQDLGDLSDPGNPPEPTRCVDENCIPWQIDGDDWEYDETNFDIFERNMHNRRVTVAVEKVYDFKIMSHEEFAEYMFNTWGVFWKEYGGFPFPSFTVVIGYNVADTGGHGVGFQATDESGPENPSNNVNYGLAHEMYHSWNGSAISQEGHRTWFVEGVTMYCSVRMAVTDEGHLGNNHEAHLYWMGIW